MLDELLPGLVAVRLVDDRAEGRAFGVDPDLAGALDEAEIDLSDVGADQRHAAEDCPVREHGIVLDVDVLLPGSGLPVVQQSPPAIARQHGLRLEDVRDALADAGQQLHSSAVWSRRV